MHVRNNKRRIELFSYLGFYPFLILMMGSAFVPSDIESMLIATSLLPACNIFFYGVILDIADRVYDADMVEAR